MGLVKTQQVFKRLSDNEVVSRVLEGERELFEILMRRHNQMLFRVIRGYVRQEEDVMDIMQEAYLKAFSKLEGFKGEAGFSTWLIRIGINEALQFLRKNKKVIRMDAYEIKENTCFGNEVKRPDQSVMNKELGNLITMALDNIPEKYRVVFILSEIEQMPQAETAVCLNISVNNVKVRLHRAKNLLKDKLLHYTHDPSLLEFGSTKCDRIVENVMSRIL